jgi:hypothetical protein
MDAFGERCEVSFLTAKLELVAVVSAFFRLVCISRLPGVLTNAPHAPSINLVYIATRSRPGQSRRRSNSMRS